MKTLIFAGTHAQAVYWRESRGLTARETEYVHDVKALRDRSTGGVPRVFVGTFHQRADVHDIQLALLLSDLHDARPHLDAEG